MTCEHHSWLHLALCICVSCTHPSPWLQRQWFPMKPLQSEATCPSSASTVFETQHWYLYKWAHWSLVSDKTSTTLPHTSGDPLQSSWFLNGSLAFTVWSSEVLCVRADQGLYVSNYVCFVNVKCVNVWLNPAWSVPKNQGDECIEGHILWSELT